MVIKIVRCQDSLMWYANHIGHTAQVISEDYDTYLVRQIGTIYTNIVKKCDAEVREE